MNPLGAMDAYIYGDVQTCPHMYVGGAYIGGSHGCATYEGRPYEGHPYEWRTGVPRMNGARVCHVRGHMGCMRMCGVLGCAYGGRLGT